MKHKKINLDSERDILLISNINSIIASSHQTIIGAINEYLIYLFWDIGELIDQSLLNSLAKNPTSLTDELEISLIKSFGAYFQSSNILMMHKFYKSCSKRNLKLISQWLSWDYVPKFVNLVDEESWIYYTNLIYHNSLTPIELEKAINENQFQNSGIKINYKEYPFAEIFQLHNKVEPLSRMKSIIQDNSTDKFKKLFEPSKYDIDADQFSSNPYQQLYKDISIKVLELQKLYNTIVNIYFNQMFANIGSEILRMFSMFTYNQDEIIKKLSSDLIERFLYKFDESEIRSAMKFSKAFKDSNYRIEMVGLVTWDHIKVLLTLENIEAQIYHARQTLSEGLTAVELQQLLISINNKNNTTVKPLNQKDVKEYVYKDRKNKSNSKIINVNVQEVDEPEYSIHDLNRNIFKNGSLMSFLKAIYSHTV